jgi:hypothetical protein
MKMNGYDYGLLFTAGGTLISCTFVVPHMTFADGIKSPFFYGPLGLWVLLRIVRAYVNEMKKEEDVKK